MSDIGSSGAVGEGAGPNAKVEDPNGMERLTGETDEQYVARQTRLRDEAKARMAAKFGTGGTSRGGGLGGMGSGAGVMGGVGSDPDYDPRAGDGAGGGGDFVDELGAISSSVLSGLGSAFGVLSAAASTAAAAVQDELPPEVSSSVASTAGSFWGGLSAGASNLMQTVAPEDPGSDGLSELQQQFHAQRSVNPSSKYGGFGSDSMGDGIGGAGGGVSKASPAPTAAPPSVPASTLGEALPAEAKAHMAAKVGGGGGTESGTMVGGGGGAADGLGGVTSASAPSSGNLGNAPTQMPVAPSSGN